MIQEILFEYFVAITAIAGLAVVWRNWLVDHPNWSRAIKKNLGAANKILSCGSCFTYWLALIYVIIFDPLSHWNPLSYFGSSEALFTVIKLFISWMSVSYGAVLLRFVYVAIQELVSWQVHTLNDRDGHKH